MEINLPCFIRFNDYHEIDYLVSLGKRIIPGFKGFEMSEDFWNKNNLSPYIGFFYIGKKPTKTEIQKFFDDLPKKIKDNI
jgi:predicted acetyltransferase